MNKLRLAIDSLEVTSFATVPREDGEKGTVRGNYLDTEAQCESTRVERNCFCTGPVCEYTYTCPINCRIIVP